MTRTARRAALAARTARRAALAALTALAAVAAIIAADFTPTASAQSEDQTTGRIVARLLEDGRVEFGWQPTGGARALPRQRYFPADATVDRWLRSSPVEVGGAEIGRINARLLSDGRIEFAFTPTDGERILTDARYFPTSARPNRWLRSTEIAIGPVAPRYVTVSAGDSHTCAIRESDSAIECWGANWYRETDAPEGSYSAISVGDRRTCAIRTSGELACWGRNKFGQSDAPEGSYIAVSAGGLHTCAIRENGAIACWGLNEHYGLDDAGVLQLIGTGKTDAPDGRFTTVSAGSSHTCAIRESGAIKCWGPNGFSTLDPVTQEAGYVEIGQSDAPEGSYTAVSAGSTHTCAIRESGAIDCWGYEAYGKVVDAPDGSFTAVSTGTHHTCAIRASDGAIECWGDNRYDQSDAPPGSYTAVSAGWWHTCAIRESGAIACWGDNTVGQATPPTN